MDKVIDWIRYHMRSGIFLRFELPPLILKRPNNNPLLRYPILKPIPTPNLVIYTDRLTR